jgi:hypothetical protein
MNQAVKSAAEVCSLYSDCTAVASKPAPIAPTPKPIAKTPNSGDRQTFEIWNAGGGFEPLTFGF